MAKLREMKPDLFLEAAWGFSVLGSFGATMSLLFIVELEGEEEP